MEMPLFQAFLRPSSSKVTDGLCIKDSTTIDPTCGSGYFLSYIFGKHWNMHPHHDLHVLFVLFPDETVFFALNSLSISSSAIRT
jgi:hypothetical protein